MNRGVEISSEIADGSKSLILDQVTNGVAVRMVVARTKTGRERVFAGCYVLRKSNIEEPPTGWHIHKASLAPVTQPGNISKLLFRQCNS